jgi:tetratricopeptide (TPR) repeat protein
VAGPLLSRDDLDELSDTAAGADDPAAVAAQLADAAASGRVADPADAGYAYLLAAEIHERADDLAQALRLTERALAAYRDLGDQDAARPRTQHARLLLQLGRDRAAMTELAELRPLMISDELVATAVPEALEAGGQAEVALQWLTEALAELGPAASGVVADQLAASRDRIRAAVEASPEPYADDQELAADDGYQDEDNDEPAEAEDSYPRSDSYRDSHRGGDPWADPEAVLLVWPQDAYEQVDQRWPEVLEPTGAESWDGYRRYCQDLIAGWTKRSGSPLFQVTGDADEFEEWLAEQGADPYHANLVALAQSYGDHLAAQVDPVELPPGPGDPCWCGSGVTYARCCLPLSPP